MSTEEAITLVRTKSSANLVRTVQDKWDMLVLESTNIASLFAVTSAASEKDA